ncbi:MAG: NADH-quinone oxidoreductase subunit J [Gammaproteobacteria bacterium]
MSIQSLLLHSIFYGFSAVLLFSAIMVVASNNPVRSVLFLVLAFFASAGLWILLEAEFLALILLLVYVGAVMTLFLFVVMMIDVGNLQTLKRTVKEYIPLAVILVLMIVLMLLLVIGPEYFGLVHVAKPALLPAEYSNVRALGSVLYTHYVYAFEVAAIILLVAMVSAISLTHRPSQNAKKQSPSEQVRVRREDRVRMVKMPSAKKRGEAS